VDFEHLRFLPTQFTLITAFRSSDNCCQLACTPPLFPDFHHPDTAFPSKSGKSLSRLPSFPSATHFHTPREFILSLALFVPASVYIIEIPAFWPYYPIRC